MGEPFKNHSQGFLDELESEQKKNYKLCYYTGEKCAEVGSRTKWLFSTLGKSSYS